MTKKEMLAQKDYLSACYVAADRHVNDIYRLETQRHNREMIKLNTKAAPLKEKAQQLWDETQAFNKIIFGEVFIENHDRKWPTFNVYKPDAEHTCWTHLAWFRAHGNGHWEGQMGCSNYRHVDDGWSWGCALQAGYPRSGTHRSGQLELGPVDPSLPNDGFYHHLPAVKAFLANAGITLLD